MPYEEVINRGTIDCKGDAIFTSISPTIVKVTCDSCLLEYFVITIDHTKEQHEPY